MQTIRYVSDNEHKITEVTDILSKKAVHVIGIKQKIEELQSADLFKLIHDKTLKAFQSLGRPVFVEHTGLILSALGELPGGLTQLFWDQLGNDTERADRFCALFGQAPDNKAIAKTIIGYTDGRTIRFFEGQVQGRISPTPRGDRQFQWDCVFIPEGFDKTYAELGEQKHAISMRKLALEQFTEFLSKTPDHTSTTQEINSDVSELAKQIAAKQVILFVGAGVSMNMGYPSFKQLMDKLALRLEFDPAVFHTLGDYLSLAEYFAITKEGLAELPACLQEATNSLHRAQDASEIYQAIIDLHCPVIYTTNYDELLEQAFTACSEPYIKISRISDLAETKPGITQIIKYHGDFTQRQQLVLTESSYFKRMKFDTPLDIRLRSDIIGKTVLFIGYSLSDINIRYLLYQLHQLWEADDAVEAKPKSYIFLSKPNLVQEAILSSRKIIPIIANHDDPRTALLEFLKRIRG